VLVGELQVLLHRLLPDHLLDLALSFHVEGVFVQQPHLLQSLLFALLILPHHLHPHFFELIGVVDGIRQRRPLCSHLRHRCRVAQYTQPRCLDLLRALVWLLPLLRILLSSALRHVVL
jgi:hypothetical protein